MGLERRLEVLHRLVTDDATAYALYRLWRLRRSRGKPQYVRVLKSDLRECVQTLAMAERAVSSEEVELLAKHRSEIAAAVTMSEDDLELWGQPDAPAPHTAPTIKVFSDYEESQLRAVKQFRADLDRRFG